MNSDLNETPENTAVQETQPENLEEKHESNELAPDLAVELLKRNPTTIEDVDAIRRAAFYNPTNWGKLELYVRDQLTEDDPDYEQKYSMGLAILGLYELAESKLEGLKDMPVAACLLGRLYLETDRAAKAAEIFKQLHERVPEIVRYHHFYIESLEAADDMDGFRRELEHIESSAADDAWTLYFQGLSKENDGEYDEAVELYEKSLEKDSSFAKPMFRLAYRKDLEGFDDEAIEMYKKCSEIDVTNMASIMNMGILYEDAERYDEACNCFNMVQNIHRTLPRARIYKRDADASTIMYYDEEKEKKEDKQAQILRIPVTDFELSVRSRNCLSKMNLQTLGDLISKTEAELLAFKNFGETSLQEIKGILASKGLRLGMITPDTEEIPSFIEPISSDDKEESILNKPLDELDLSVRSRNCLNLLQIKTLGQLAEVTEQQLVSCKNFGQTSLNEIRKKLSDYGLSLKV